MVREYSRRFSLCILSLVFFSFSNFASVRAGAAGTNAWSTLSMGLSGKFGITFGTATLIISLVIIAVDLLGRGKLGFGSFFNALLVPVFSDFYLKVLDFIPVASSMAAGVIWTLAGQLILSFGTIFYMYPALGAGPRDTMMILIGKKMPGVPIGAVKFGIEMAALLVGFLMGAPLGVGTVLVLVLQASMFQFACKVMRYEPRSVNHESVFDTWRQMMGRQKAGS